MGVCVVLRAGRASRQPHVRAVALLKASVAPLLLLLVDILLVMLVLMTNHYEACLCIELRHGGGE